MGKENICTQDNCNYKTKQKTNLKQHLACIHDVGVTWQYCTQDDCNYKTKLKTNLKQHLAFIHDLGVTWNICTQDDCNYKAKQKSALTQHLADIHGLGVIWQYCTQDDCNYKAKKKSSLKQHLADIHNVGVTWNICTQDDCNYKAKRKDHLKTHLAFIHNIGVTWHICTQDDCNYKAKQKTHLKQHLACIHDIGPYECSFCLFKCARLMKIVDPQGTHNICRKCYRKSTGFKCRIEKKMVEYLIEHYKQPMLRQDRRVNGDACLAYRPDVMYADPNRVVHVACDERQHIGSLNYRCDERRMSRLYDEYSGKTVIWIRWNPDNYKPPKGKIKLKQKERLKALVEMLKYVETRTFKTKIHVIYMFYDLNNPLLVQNINKEMVF